MAFITVALDRNVSLLLERVVHSAAIFEPEQMHQEHGDHGDNKQNTLQISDKFYAIWRPIGPDWAQWRTDRPRPDQVAKLRFGSNSTLWQISLFVFLQSLEGISH